MAVEPHRHEGVFIARGKEDALVTKNMVPGEAVYGEKRISVEVGEGEKVEYRVWNPFRSKLAASVLAGLDNIYIKPGAKVLYLGAASGTSVSHVSDIVGPTGTVFAVEFSHRSGEILFQSNICDLPDAYHPCRLLDPLGCELQPEVACQDIDPRQIRAIHILGCGSVGDALFANIAIQLPPVLTDVTLCAWLQGKGADEVTIPCTAPFPSPPLIAACAGTLQASVLVFVAMLFGAKQGSDIH